MTDDRRRMLTEEVLGECWHGYTDGVTSDGQWRMCTCGYAYIIPEKHRNRTFATWKDLGHGVVVVHPYDINYLLSVGQI